MQETIIELVKAGLNRRGIDAYVSGIRTRKENGIVLDGIMIRKVDDQKGIALYYNPEFEDERIAATILKRYDAAPRPNFDPQAFLNKEAILAGVYPTLANREQNKDLLRDAVHEPWLDLEILFRIDVPATDGSIAGCLLLKQDLLEYLKITTEELLEAAMRNIQNKGIVKSMMRTLMEMRGMDVSEAVDKEDPLVIISTSNRFKGAGAIFDKAVMDQLIQRFNGSFYIMPSSVHEMIAVDDDIDKSRLLELVKNANLEVVEIEDFLSDSIYHYINGEWEVKA